MRIQGQAAAAQAVATPKAEAREVGAKKTPLAPSEIRASIQKAYTALHGEAPSPKFVDVLAAQVFHETGRGEKMHNFNFGGIKGVSPEGMTANTKTREVFDGKEVTIRDGFRAYSTPAAGAKDYIAFLERRFPKAVDAARRGDAEAFVGSLKAGNYFTADQASYTAAVKQLMQVDGARAVTAPSPTPASAVDFASLGVPSSPGAFSPDASADAVARALDGSWTSFARIRFDDGEDG